MRCIRRISQKVAYAILALSLALNCLVASADSSTVLPRSLLSDLPIPTYVWTCESSPKAIVLGLHGGCLHGRSFTRLATALVQRDYLFVSLDMRGYGKWYHQRWGTKRDTKIQYTDTIKDIEIVLERLRHAYPDIPIYCLGESLGANVAMLVAARMPELVDGVVAVSLTSPKIFVSPRMLLNVLQVVTDPAVKLDLCPYLKTRLANRKEIVCEQLNDPLGRDHQSIGELIRTIHINSLGIKAAKSVPSNLPILFIVGAQDKLGNTKRTMRIIERLPASNNQLLIVPDSGHLMVETTFINPQVLSAISQFIDERRKTYVASAHAHPQL